MENATHALYMVFAVLILVLALSVAITSFNKAKATADVVLLQEDKTNYYEYIGAKNKSDESRIVGLETIIPTLYKYYKENYTVVFKKCSSFKEDGSFENWEYMQVLPIPNNSAAIKNNWQKNYSSATGSYKKYSYLEKETLAFSKYGKKGNDLIWEYKIFSFDLDEETLRHEPWVGSYDKIKNNIDCFLNGDIYKNPNNNSAYINYKNSPLNVGSGGFISWCQSKNAKFIETVAEYKPEGIDEEEGSSSLTKEKSKRMIIFTYCENL